MGLCLSKPASHVPAGDAGSDGAIKHAQAPQGSAEVACTSAGAATQQHQQPTSRGDELGQAAAAAGGGSAGASPQGGQAAYNQQRAGSPDPDLSSPGAAGVLAGSAAVADGIGAAAAAGTQNGDQRAPQQPLQQAGLPLSSPPQQEQQQPTAGRQWAREPNVQAPSALVSAASSTKQPASRSVKFADPPPDSDSDSSRHLPDPSRGNSVGGGSKQRRGLPRRSASSSGGLRSSGPNEVSEAVLAHQADILRSNKAGKLRMRRGGLDSSFAALQDSLAQGEAPVDVVATRAAGLKHIGFGPFKRENQDEFFIQVGDFGGVPGGNLFCVFDGHGSCGKDAALHSRQVLPRLLDTELRQYFSRVAHDTEHGLRGAVDVLITEVFGDTERNLTKGGVNLASSGTTATVAFQRGNRLWVAAAGDSRAILCTRNARDQWRALPLTIDHRPRRPSERERIEAAGARVAPKRLPSGRSVGEPRLWLQHAGGPGLLLSRSLGDLTAATVGCTSDPEVTFTTLRPHVDQVLVMASDGVWDVLTNEQVCDIVVESPDPHIACRRVLDAALYEWEERMSADNITVLVVEFEWAHPDDAAAAAAAAAGAVGGQQACATAAPPARVA